MSSFFLELFTEEIPSKLQSSAREDLSKNFKLFFDEQNIEYYKNIKTISTPNRLVIYFKSLKKEILIKPEEIRGPSTSAQERAIIGFSKSNNTSVGNLYKKKTEKGEFYFYKTKSKILKTHDLLVESIPILLEGYQWKKSMKWGEFRLNWGRPLKSILSVFNKKILEFKFYHIKSSNLTYLDKDFEEKKKIFKVKWSKTIKEDIAAAIPIPNSP